MAQFSDYLNKQKASQSAAVSGLTVTPSQLTVVPAKTPVPAAAPKAATPAPAPAAPAPTVDTAAQIAAIQAKLSDLKAQQAALVKTGATDTKQLEKDETTGEYRKKVDYTIPSEVAASLGESKEDKQLRANMAAIAARLAQPTDLAAIRSQYEEQLGIPEQQKASVALNKQIIETDKLIDDLEKNISTRIGGTLTTEAGRARQQAVEQKPLVEQLSDLTEAAQLQQTNLSASRQELSDLMGLTTTQEQSDLARLQAMQGMLSYQTPQEQMAQTIAQSQLEKNLGLGSYYQAPTEKQIVGSASDGYYSYDPTTGQMSQLSQGTGNKQVVGSAEGGYYSYDQSTGQMTQLTQGTGTQLSVTDALEVQEAEAARTAAQAAAAAGYDLANTLLNSPGLGAISGVWQISPMIPGSAGALAKNQFDQLVNSISLENRQKLKGQGQVSDYEAKILAKASTALGRNLSETQMKDQLAKVRGAFATSAGMEAPIRITSPSGQVTEGAGSREEIDQLILEGNTVEYIY